LATCATSSCHGFGGNLPLLVDEPSAIANASAIHDRINRLPSEDGFMPREGDYPTEDADVNIKDYFLNLVE
jgi:hypothetical protein